MSDKDFKEGDDKSKSFAENIKVFYDKLQDKMHPLPVRMQQTQQSFTVFANKSQGVGWVEGQLNQHKMKSIN